jgi:hypothetical protein
MTVPSKAPRDALGVRTARRIKRSNGEQRMEDATNGVRALPNLGPPEAEVLMPLSARRRPTLPPAGDAKPLPRNTITPGRITPANENAPAVDVERREFAPISPPVDDTRSKCRSTRAAPDGAVRPSVSTRSAETASTKI